MTRSRFTTLFTALAVSLAITIPVLASHADDGRSRVQPLAAPCGARPKYRRWIPMRQGTSCSISTSGPTASASI